MSLVELGIYQDVQNITIDSTHYGVDIKRLLTHVAGKTPISNFFHNFQKR